MDYTSVATHMIENCFNVTSFFKVRRREEEEMERERQSELELRKEAEELAKNETRQIISLTSESIGLSVEKDDLSMCGIW